MKDMKGLAGVGILLLLAIIHVVGGGESGNEPPNSAPFQSTPTSSSPSSDSSNPAEIQGATRSGDQGMRDIIRLSVEAPAALYIRSEYEPNWKIPGDKCDIRSKMLESSSLVPVVKNKYCTVTYGKWEDPYTGEILEGNPHGGDGTQNDMDIDHIIPLHYVNSHGGIAWDSVHKLLYGKSVSSMNRGIYITVSSSANSSKGDKGPSKWMPSNAAYACQYIIKWRNIASDWQISLDPDDYDYIASRLDQCE
jgi:hypothetical protein